MTNFASKFKDILKNLKVDAVPRPPRPETESNGEVPEPVSEVNNENGDDASEYEEIIIGADDYEEKDKNKKKSFFSSNKKKRKSSKRDQDDSGVTNSTINTQANAPVINIVNSKKITIGDTHTYYTGNVAGTKSDIRSEEPIPKCNLVILLMEAEIEPTNEYLDYVSKNLGKDWHSFFRVLGYTKGQIETAEIDEARNGISEARYKLLLDWVRNEDDATLGRLATLLWEEGERQIVKELAIIYKKNKS